MLLNTVYFYKCKLCVLRSYDEHCSLECKKKGDESGRLYLEFTDRGSKTNRGGLKHMEVDNKTVRQYENLDHPDHCVVNVFETYLSFLPSLDGNFYFVHCLTMLLEHQSFLNNALDTTHWQTEHVQESWN